MPNCFQLSRKAEPTKPVRFIDIDIEICKELDIPVDPDKYCMSWYDIIGLRLACGQSFDEMRKYFLGVNEEHSAWACKMAQIVEFLDANYTSDAWYESSGRSA